MSSDNIEVAKRWIEAYYARDLEGLKAVADSEIELRAASGEVLRGHEGLAKWTAHGWEADPPHYPKADRYESKGDTVFALIDVELRSPETGDVVRVLPVGAEWKVRDGRVVRWAARPDREKLLEDAGLAKK